MKREKCYYFKPDFFCARDNTFAFCDGSFFNMDCDNEKTPVFLDDGGVIEIERSIYHKRKRFPSLLLNCRHRICIVTCANCGDG